MTMARSRLSEAGQRARVTRCTPPLLAVALLLLIPTHKVFSQPILENETLLLELSRAGSSSSELRQTPGRLQALKRFTRMTPFWRTIGSKPIGAYCAQGLECTSKLCMKGHCAYRQQFES